MFLKMSSAICDKLLEDVFDLVEYLTWNFVSIIFFRILVFRVFAPPGAPSFEDGHFFRVMILFLGRRLYFLIVLNTFLSM